MGVETSEMLNKINEAEVSSTDGFFVRIARDHISYAEGERALSIPIEALFNPHSLAVNAKLIGGWYPPHNHEAIAADKKNEVIARTEQVLKFLKIRYEIIN